MTIPKKREKAKLGVDGKKKPGPKSRGKPGPQAGPKPRARTKSAGKPTSHSDAKQRELDERAFMRARARLDKTKGNRYRDRHWAFYWNMCPKCGGDMFEQVLQDIRFEVCRACKSIHFDQAELALVSKYLDIKKFIKAALLISRKPDSPKE